MRRAGQLNSRIILATLTDNSGLTGAPACVFPPTPSSLVLQGVSQEQVSLHASNRDRRLMLNLHYRKLALFLLLTSPHSAQVFDVKQYGHVVCGDVTDDITAIQSTINAAATSP